MTTFFITGGAGFIGSTLVEQLLKKNKVVVIDNFYCDEDEKEKNIEKVIKNKNYKLYKKDIRDRDSIKQILDENRIDIVIHLAAMTGVRESVKNPVLYAEVNDVGTQNILEESKLHNISKIILASSSSVYGNCNKTPFNENMKIDKVLSPYAATKKSNEIMAYVYHKLYNIDFLVLRFFSVYGPKQRNDLAINKFTKLMLEKKEIPMYGDGKTLRDYTYIDDIVEGIILSSKYLLKNDSVYEILNLGNGHPISLNEVINIIGESLNITPKIRKLPPQLGDVNITHADITKAKKMIKYNPKVDFKKKKKKYIDWYKESINSYIKKKVVIIGNDTTYIFNLRLSIIKELLKQNYDVYLVTKVIYYEEELKKIGCKIIDIDNNRHNINLLSNIKLFFKYKKILKRINPEYILSYNIKPNLYVGIINKKLKAKFMPNVTGLGKALGYPSFLQKIIIFISRISFKSASVVFFQNQSNMNFFEKYKILNKKTKKILLPGSGVDLEKFKLLEYPDTKKIKFLFIARIMKEKGIDIYLEVAKYIKFKYSNTEFHVCGYCDDKKYDKKLKKFEKEKIIIYHGEQKNISNLIKKSNVVIHPTYYPEGMSNVLLESAASGRPIICTDIPGCKEIVDDGKTGFVVPEKNFFKTIESVEKIIAMSNSKRKQMGLNARKKIEKQFDRKVVVKKYMSEIK